MDDALFLDTTLAGWRARTTAAARDVRVADGVLASPRALTDARTLLKAHATVRSTWALAEELAALTDTPLVLTRAGAQAGGEVPPADLAPRAQALGFRLPGSDRALEVADAWVLPVGHWTQRLWANLLAMGPFLWSELVGQGVFALGNLAWAALRAGSTRPEDMAARLNVLGKGAQIHRNATVEGCVLGPGARVGAGAVVRGCVLGPGAVIEELALVEGAVLGEAARVQRMAMLKFSTLGRDAQHAGMAQLGVIEDRAVVKNGAILMDMALGGKPVRVDVSGQLKAAPFGLCGVHVGAGATLAQGVRVGPGREVPPGVTVFGGGDVLRDTRVPDGVTTARVVDGKLEALS